MKAKRSGGGEIISFRRFVVVAWLYILLLYATVFVTVAVAFSETRAKAKRPRKNTRTRTRKNTRRQNSKPAPSLQGTLQNCFTPTSILKDVAVLLTPAEDSLLSSVTLVRLSKQLISLDNKRNNNNNNNNNNSLDSGNSDASTVEDFIINKTDQRLWDDGLTNAVKCLSSSKWAGSSQNLLEAAVEGIKAASVISRLLPKCEDPSVVVNGSFINDNLWWTPLLEKIVEEDQQLVSVIQPHQLSGLKWSIDCFRLSTNDAAVDADADADFSHKSLPKHLQKAYDNLDLPFMVRPGFLTKISSRDRNKHSSTTDGQDDYDCDEHDNNDFTVASFVNQVDFNSEKIQTTSKRAVAERRETAWQGDEHVAPFEYSGKSMQRMPWSPIVANARDRLCEETSHYYDGCLLNLYPDGGSGMRYHIDPDQGVQWDFETVVVSIGATRRFAFRSIVNDATSNGADGQSTTSGEQGAKDGSKPHMFVLMDGDVTEMVRDCQARFQHTVKTAEFKGETAPRVSLVFKKTLANRK
uniref:Fe2OG dioxygenase domain-containing protein n=1 Tax=Pseudo-nitzschia australis TaxID=44445 RepID=A0A6U9XLU6_9STRA|mmetsp:Transcript_6264/g.12582  ORF Transcript_6264/g.12582 Transcript_6264/m.12582 type:complete len:523 (-) Transcript_6264:103-1671(-)